MGGLQGPDIVLEYLVYYLDSVTMLFFGQITVCLCLFVCLCMCVYI